MSALTLDEQRERFEALAIEQYLFAYFFKRDGRGDYVELEVDIAWNWFQKGVVVGSEQ